MLTKLMDGLSNKLADQWMVTLLTPAFVFWAGGLIAWVWHFGLPTLERWFTVQPPVVQVTIVIGALLVVVTSAVIVQRFDLIVLRFLEGYWPRWLRRPRKWLINREAARRAQIGRRFQALASKGLKNLSAEERDEYATLDLDLMRMPATPDRLMPTTLGNILVAAELRSKDKYGLDSVICWPRLWLLLPESVKKDLIDSRTILNITARLWSWGILFLIWTIWIWWAIFAGLIVALFAYRWMLNAAEVYGDLLDSTFDLYRTELYKSLRWPLPENPSVERQAGVQVTDYLWRGSDAAVPIFTKAEK